MANVKKKEKSEKTDEQKKKKNPKKKEEKEKQVKTTKGSKKKESKVNVDNKKNDSSKKQLKKESKKIENVSGIDTNVSHIVIMTSCIIIVFCAFYFLSFYITRESRAKQDDDVVISYDEILLGRSFNMTDEDYYVIYYDQSDDSVLTKVNDLLSTKTITSPIYKVDMSDSFNKKYASTPSNKEAKSAEELIINGLTMIHFNNKSIVDYYEGESEVGPALNEGE